MEPRRYACLATWAREKREQAGRLAVLALEGGTEPLALLDANTGEPVAHLQPASERELPLSQVA